MTRRRLKLRLIVAYVCGLLLGLLAFSAIAVVSIDQALRRSVDSRLDTAIRTTLKIIHIRNGRLFVERDDFEQFFDLLGLQFNGMVEDAYGRVVLSSVSRVPPMLMDADNVMGQVTLGGGDETIRAQVAPIVRDGVRYGSLVVWRSSDWIGETDLRIAIAFSLAASVITVLAVIAGNAVAQRALDDAVERQRRFTADASHEFRAPLAVIVAEADLALSRRREPDEYIGTIESIAGEARRIEALVDDLLWTARGDAPSMRCVPLDVGAAITKSADRLGAVAASRGASLTIQTEADAIANVDPGAFRRALTAIVHNAAKFARGRIEVDVTHAGDHVEVRIADDGPGFSEAGLLHATERFWRDDRARGKDGNGLGLSIARAIVESCGGTLSIANGCDGGAIVTLHLQR